MFFLVPLPFYIATKSGVGGEKGEKVGGVVKKNSKRATTRVLSVGQKACSVVHVEGQCRVQSW